MEREYSIDLNHLRIRMIVLLMMFWGACVYGGYVGDTISNVASIYYKIDGTDHNTTTNEANVTIAQTPATIELLMYDSNGSNEVLNPTRYRSGDTLVQMPPALTSDGRSITPPATIPITDTDHYLTQDLVIIRVKDLDQNTHIDTRQSVDINITNTETGEQEELRLMETGANTGVFVGYSQTTAQANSLKSFLQSSSTISKQDGQLSVVSGDVIVATYIDNITLKHVEAKAHIVNGRFNLLTTKEQSKNIASIGEYLKYTITVENIGTSTYKNISIVDQLPDGLKYVTGSLRVDGKPATPTLSPDGKQITYIYPSLSPRSKAIMDYVAVVGAGVVDHQAINRAWAQASGDNKSNIAKTTLKIKEELWRSKGFIAGRVYEADVPCEYNATKGVDHNHALPISSVIGVDGKPHPKQGCGVGGVKLYMEDGRYVVTDKHGKYHFVDISNGTHVVQVDEETIAGRYTLETCEQNVQTAHNNRSRFVELYHGGLDRVDFCLRRIEGLVGNTMLDIHIAPRGAESVTVTLRTNADMRLINPEVFLSLSDGLQYIDGSSTSAKEPSIKDGILDIEMGSMHEVKLGIKATDNTIPDKEIKAILYYDTQLTKDEHSDIAYVTFVTAKGKEAIAKITQASDEVTSDSAGGRANASMGDYNWTKPTHQITMPEYSAEDIDQMGTKPQIVWPPDGWVPDIPSTRVAILYPQGDFVELRLNGHKVSTLNYEGLFRSAKTKMNIIHYKGVDLVEGTNRFVALIKHQGKVVKWVSRTIYVESHAPQSISFLPKYSYLVADGKHNPIIAVRMIGPSGHPLRGGLVGSFSTDPRHSPATMCNDSGQYTVDSQGIAYIELKPVAIAGEGIIRIKMYGGKYKSIHFRLKPYMRPWIVVGLAEGTVGYRIVSGHAQELKNKSLKNGLYVDGRLAFFAKGQIKGSWLMTIAYDSGRKKGDRRLFDAIDPNAYYTIYQDATTQHNEAPSTKKLYLKLEKDQFSVLFGDFASAINGGEFDRYQHNFTGLRSEYRGVNTGAVFFAAQTDKLHYRDDIRGDGTSGYYQATHKPIIEGSESVTIVVRDRYRPEIVLASKTLHRWIDYSIDYDTGELYFKEPIFSTDQQFNPQYIVLRYDIEGDGKSHFTYGGRVEYLADDEAFEIGATAIRQEHGDGNDNLWGIDGRVHIDKHVYLRAEAAYSHNTKEHTTINGKAYKAELVYDDKNTTAKAYYRYQDDSFGLANLAPQLAGTRKIGLDLHHQIDKHWYVSSSLYQSRKYTDKSHNDENVWHPTLGYRDYNQTISVGYLWAKNTLTPATHQATFGFGRFLMSHKLKLALHHNQSLSTNKDQTFPTRTTATATYKMDRNLSVSAQVERSDRDGDVTYSARAGVAYKPWKGGEVKLSRTLSINDGNIDTYDTLGLMHHWKLSKRWAVGMGYEKGIAEHNSSHYNFDALRLDGKYNDGNFSSDGSVEYRDGALHNKLNLSWGLYVRQNKNMGLAFGMGWHRQWGAHDKHRGINAKAAIAYRPDISPWIILDRMDYIDELQSDETQNIRTSKLINNFVLNYHPNENWEFGIQYGLKYILDHIDDHSYAGWVDLMGLDATYYIDETWAVGLHGSTLHAYGAHNMDYAWGAHLDTSPWRDTKVTFGYNISGFEDEDFSQQNYHHQGPYIQFKLKFDQDDIKNIVEDISQ